MRTARQIAAPIDAHSSRWERVVVDGVIGFEEFVGARSKALLRTAYVLTGDHHHAEDLLQTALTTLYLHWGDLRDPRAAETYVRRVLVTTYTSWWRRRSWRERPTADIPDTAPETTGSVGGSEDMWLHLKALPRQQRAVVVLRFYEDLSVEETAALLGISAGSVKSHTSRALATLRRRLGQAEPLPASSVAAGGVS